MNNNILGPRARGNLLKGRRDELIGLLPKDWRKRVLIIDPEFDTNKGSNIMTNVRSQKSCDEKLIEIWEQVIVEAKEEGAKIACRSKQALKRQKVAIPSLIYLYILQDCFSCFWALELV